MKKVNSIILGAMICASVGAFMSCGNKTQAGGVSDSDSVGMDTITVETQCDTLSNNNVFVTVSMSLPNGDGVAQTIRETLVSLMGEQIYKDADFLGDGSMKGKPFAGDATDVKAICTFYCRNIYKVVNKQFNDDAAEALQSGDSSYIAPERNSYFQMMSLVKDSEAANYIVFNDQASGFRGGCHEGGVDGDHFIIFNRTTGTQVKNIFKPGSAAKMQRMLLDGFRAYFKACDSDDPDAVPISEDDDILSMLSLPEGSNNIPLPKGSTVRPTADGLEVSYAVEEIGPFALGHPVFTIPYDKVEPFMTAEALELLK